MAEIGNQWLKCDFHLHTKASSCFKDENTSAEANVIQLAVVRRVIKTDHPFLIQMMKDISLEPSDFCE